MAYDYETVEAEVPEIDPHTFTDPKAIAYDSFAIGLHNALQAISEACNVPLPNGLKLDDVEPLIDMRKSIRRTIGTKAERCNRIAQMFENSKAWK
jgi:hypothetical protein